ncbi:DNA-directed RNA polymerase II subunit 4 [Quillaja saponaria]|uniref:DNA-directed RNA polymerase II subunit 4 n=1 Tax=Quillaja saponaria TaxID=32244 RepID=A0AAD7M0V1_QUISA|nr:DNA-directed RNA polymerase II subunit 4 [Quillaja saponaria]
MSEKGGKGFSLLNKGGSLKGKDDNAPKSTKGRKVQFSYEGSNESRTGLSSKSGGKVETAIPKGDWSKGGKGDKVAYGGKSPVSKEKRPLELKIEQELPTNAKCMFDCEATHILEGIQEQMVVLSKDPTIKIPVSFDRGLQYAKSTSHFKNPLAVRPILEFLTDFGVSDGEICLISNMCPETIDEAFALVPSLKDKRILVAVPLKDALSELSKLKQSK